MTSRFLLRSPHSSRFSTSAQTRMPDEKNGKHEKHEKLINEENMQNNGKTETKVGKTKKHKKTQAQTS